MHRHGYQGRKFNRETDQRRALLKGLAEALIINGSVKTTISKAKELSSYIEPLVTKALKADLHSRRQVIASLQTISNAHKLVDEIAPKLKGRNGGYVRIKSVGFRRGDSAQMVLISFVEELKPKPSVAKQSGEVGKTKPKVTAVTSTKKTVKKPVKATASRAKVTP